MAAKVKEIDSSPRLDNPLNLSELMPERPYHSEDNFLRKEEEYYRERDRIRLQPANAEMAPIYVDPQDLRIQGRVVALIRHL